MGSCSAQLLWEFCGGFGAGSGLGWGEGGWVVLWRVGRYGRRDHRGQESLGALSSRRRRGATSLGLTSRTAVALVL